LEELNSDWTATQEVADRLMAHYGVPFRVGHHVASAMVGWARANNVLPLQFPYAKMQEIFREVTGKEWHEMELPMSEAEFRDALDPKAIVENRKTEGGPQAASIEAMLVTRREQNDAARQWCAKRTAQIDEALARLENDFAKYL
jgi:argininosuccinate lyase